MVIITEMNNLKVRSTLPSLLLNYFGMLDDDYDQMLEQSLTPISIVEQVLLDVFRVSPKKIGGALDVLAFHQNYCLN